MCTSQHTYPINISETASHRSLAQFKAVTACSSSAGNRVCLRVKRISKIPARQQNPQTMAQMCRQHRLASSHYRIHSWHTATAPSACSHSGLGELHFLLTVRTGEMDMAVPSAHFFHGNSLASPSLVYETELSTAERSLDVYRREQACLGWGAF